jgi:AraC-like DNA-binding protein
MVELEAVSNIVAIDCCEHIIAALKSIRYSHVTTVTGDPTQIAKGDRSIQLIVIGVPQFPIRRLFLSHLRRLYPAVPALILRREAVSPGVDEEWIRGEFILSDRPHSEDFELVRRIREILPLKPCKHTLHRQNSDVVREVIRIILEKYSDPDLDLGWVARRLPVSPKRLSHILNHEVGVSFRQMLRSTRIEEAKRMLASGQYSVKEVAVRVGFSDSHYFSRSFKELTGLSASEFRSYSPLHS